MRHAACALAALAVTLSARAEVLTVCADPNNLPFSNQAQQGLENKLVKLIAADLHLQVRYEWWAQRRGFARNTVASARCDLWPGVAAGIGSMATSIPYYRSTYVFVTRRSSSLAQLSLDDARLRELTIGVQMVGDDSTNTPPAHALSARGITQNVRAYMLYGDYHRPNPPAAIVRAVWQHDVEVAIVWGPLAGYFAARSPVPLRLQPVEPQTDRGWPMSYDIAIGVRRGEADLLARVNAVLAVEHVTIARLLEQYHVPAPPTPLLPVTAQR